MGCCCCVPGCTSSRRRKTPGISFHEIPADMVLREKWLKVIARKNWVPNDTSNYSCVCSTHFLPTDFKQNIKRKQLIPTAVPSLFPMYPSYMQPKILKTRASTNIAKRSAAPPITPKSAKIARDPPHPSTAPNEEIVVLPGFSANGCEDKAVQVDVLRGFRGPPNQDRQWEKRYLRLTAKMRRLQESLDSTKMEFEKYKAGFGKEFEKYNDVLQHATNGTVPAILLRDQIRNYAKKRPTWSEATIRCCVMWRKCTRKGYTYILNNKLMKLPTRTTLTKCLRSVKEHNDGAGSSS